MNLPLLPDDEFNRKLKANCHPSNWLNPEPQGRYHMAVIGGGTAGLVTAGAGVEYSDQGIDIDDQFRSSNHRVYAAGDVASNLKFTHAADFMARAVIQNALFPAFKKKVSSLIIPWCTYTDPELAHVGLTAQEADADDDVVTLTQPWSDLDRAIVDEQTNGFVRVHLRKGSDRVLGATVVGSRAGELISEISLAMTNRLGLRKIARTIHPYPTYAESIRKLGDEFNRKGFSAWKKWVLQQWFRWTG